MTADLAWAFRDGADDSDSEWLLKTAAAIVESECTTHGFEGWGLRQRRQEIDSPLVQRALDVLAGGVLTTSTDEDHEHGGESG